MWCGIVVTGRIWLLGAQIQPVKVAGRQQTCHASHQDTGDDVGLQNRAMDGRDDILGTPGQHRILRSGVSIRENEEGQSIWTRIFCGRPWLHRTVTLFSSSDLTANGSQN